jgi:hypothetical protein
VFSLPPPGGDNEAQLVAGHDRLWMIAGVLSPVLTRLPTGGETTEARR